MLCFESISSIVFHSWIDVIDIGDSLEEDWNHFSVKIMKWLEDSPGFERSQYMLYFDSIARPLSIVLLGFEFVFFVGGRHFF